MDRETLARELWKVRSAQSDGTPNPAYDSWDKISPATQRAYRRMAGHALTLLAGAPAVPPAEPYVPQVGDIVGMDGVVTHVSNGLARVDCKGQNGIWLRSERLTLIERPPPPEPDWQPGDVAQDESGEVYLVNSTLLDGVIFAGSDGLRYYGRDEIDGPLKRCRIVPEDGEQ